MNKDERNKIYQALSAPFPENCIERTDGHVTGKGYSTTGIKSQFVINRLNEVVGLGGWRTERTLSVKEVTTARGRAAFEAICAIKLELGEWVDGKFVPFGEALGDGGHTSTSEADARKGAFSNALKKAAALFGCGREAYQGTIDDDNAPDDEPSGYALASRPIAGKRQPAAAESQRAEAPGPTTRRRLTSRQLAAIWRIVEARSWQRSTFQERVKGEHGVTVEFLTAEQASHLLDKLNGSLNGHAEGPQ